MNVIVKFYALAVLLVTFRSDIMVMKPAEVESRTQGSRPTPRTLKNFEAKGKDRPSRGQGLRTQSQELLKKRSSKIFFRRSPKKKSSKIFFRQSLLDETQKKVFADFPQGFWRFSTKFQRFKNSAVLEPRTGQFSRT